MPFTDDLQQMTDDAHKSAEGSTFIGRLLGGEESRDAYVRLIAEYLPIYTVLEQGITTLGGQPPVAAFYDPRLERADALRHDLTQLGGPVTTDPLPATREYVDRLRELAATSPVRLLAHHYLRYLGDLSGGQVIGRLAGRHYDIPAEALTTWEFTEIGKPKPYKDAYRAKLNTAFTEAEQAEFIAEALEGYRLAGELFDNLGNERVTK